jgi:hypothetical protein
MNDRPDLSWWTEDKNPFMMGYLEKELHRIRCDRNELRANRIRVTCVRCNATVVEVVKIKLPDEAETRVHAIGFHKFTELPLIVNVAADANPDELARARAQAREARDRHKRSARRRPRDWIYALEGSSTALLKIQAGHDCVDDQGKKFPDERLLAAQKIIDGEITTIDPGPDARRRRPPELD